MSGFDADFAVVGGGVVGTAIAFGLAQRGQSVVVLDEGDMARRASRANFALVWVSSKGLGMGRYSAWSMTSAEAWPAFADALRQTSGIDVAYQNPGGFIVAISVEEMERRVDTLRRVVAQPGAPDYPFEVLDHDETARRLPGLGPDVVGSTYSPIDGHVNSLRLFLALHASMHVLGIDYRAEHRVTRLEGVADGVRLVGDWGEGRAQKVVIAAGLDTGRIAAMAGMDVPVIPSKGQILVTEKVAPFLHYPISTVRQTDEGGVMVGDSQEEKGLDDTVTSPVLAIMARRAVQTFPHLERVNVVRTWAALRVMSPDGFPIYTQSTEVPGVFAVATHSGVTLAAAHASILADQLIAGALPADMAPFGTERFDVPAAA